MSGDLEGDWDPNDTWGLKLKQQEVKALKASEVVERLQVLIAKHGDLPVYVFGGQGSSYLQKVDDVSPECVDVCSHLSNKGEPVFVVCGL